MTTDPMPDDPRISAAWGNLLGDAVRSGQVRVVPDEDHTVTTATPPEPARLSWDWREQPDLDRLAAILADHGVTLTQVDTGSDLHEVEISATPPEPTVETIDGVDVCPHRWTGDAGRAHTGDHACALPPRHQPRGGDHVCVCGATDRRASATPPEPATAGPDWRITVDLNTYNLTEDDTDELLDAIRGLAVERVGDESQVVVTHADIEPVTPPEPAGTDPTGLDLAEVEQVTADAETIGDARHYVPALVAEVRRLRDGWEAASDRVAELERETADMVRVIADGDMKIRKLTATLAAVPDAHDAANLAHAHDERDRLRARVAELETLLAERGRLKQIGDQLRDQLYQGGWGEACELLAQKYHQAAADLADAENPGTAAEAFRAAADCARATGAFDAAPTVWALPPEPGAETARLWDEHGCHWDRYGAHAWKLTIREPSAHDPNMVIASWPGPLEHGPLSSTPPAGTERPDPTHGRIDPDIQTAVDEMNPVGIGQRVAIENTLQARRDARSRPTPAEAGTETTATAVAIGEDGSDGR